MIRDAGFFVTDDHQDNTFLFMRDIYDMFLILPLKINSFCVSYSSIKLLI